MDEDFMKELMTRLTTFTSVLSELFKESLKDGGIEIRGEMFKARFDLALPQSERECSFLGKRGMDNAHPSLGR